MQNRLNNKDSKERENAKNISTNGQKKKQTGFFSKNQAGFLSPTSTVSTVDAGRSKGNLKITVNVTGVDWLNNDLLLYYFY